MYYTYEIETGKKACYYIRPQVDKALADSGIKNGICLVYCPHTSCGVTINENAGPDVPADLMYSFEHLFPRLDAYRHIDSEEHIRASVCGSSVMIIVEDGQLVLGKWQDIYLCEFNSERTPRKIMVKFIEG